MAGTENVVPQLQPLPSADGRLSLALRESGTKALRNLCDGEGMPCSSSIPSQSPPATAPPGGSLGTPPAGGTRDGRLQPFRPFGPPPLAQGRLYACGRDVGRENASQSPPATAPLKGSQGGRTCFILLLFAIGRLCATAAIYGGPTAFIVYRSITKHLPLRGWQFRAVPAGASSENASMPVFAWPRRADHVTPVKCL